MNDSPFAAMIYISGTPSPTTLCPPEALEQGKHLGALLGGRGIDVATTATSGFPLWVALAAHRGGSTTLAFSPAASAREHQHVYQQPEEGFSSLVYTGFGTSGASVMGVRSSDAVIFGCGGMSSILELVTAIQESKPIGILEGSWGIDDVLEEMLATHYPEYPYVVAHSDPEELVALLVSEIKKARA